MFIFRCLVKNTIVSTGLTVVGIAQEINIQNMNVELVAQMFKNYQSNVLFHLEGRHCPLRSAPLVDVDVHTATDSLKDPA